jgi:hypothetical protein
MDEFTNNFAYIGRRTTGTKAGSFPVVGPSWQGPASQEIRVIRAPTPDVTLLVRILVDGPEEALRLLAPQRGLIATGEKQKQVQRHEAR